MSKPKIMVLADGTATGGGSGFNNLVQHALDPNGDLDADIVVVVSSHPKGGVYRFAHEFDIPFVHLQPPRTAEAFAKIFADYGAEWTAASGYTKFIKGLDPRTTFNIHNASLVALNGAFGGKGKHGLNTHKVVKKAMDSGKVTKSGVSMHFVTDGPYDSGPIFFIADVLIGPTMTAEQIGKAVNKVEHQMQPYITNLVVHSQIRWDGKNPESLVYPDGYKWYPGYLNI